MDHYELSCNVWEESAGSQQTYWNLWWIPPYFNNDCRVIYNFLCYFSFSKVELGLITLPQNKSQMKKRERVVTKSLINPLVAWGRRKPSKTTWQTHITRSKNNWPFASSFLMSRFPSCFQSVYYASCIVLLVSKIITEFMIFISHQISQVSSNKKSLTAFCASGDFHFLEYIKQRLNGASRASP